MIVTKARSFDELAEYYLRRAIASDLQDLLGDKPSSPHELTSRSPNNDIDDYVPSVSSSSLDSALRTSQTLRKYSEVSPFQAVASSAANTVCQVSFPT